MGGYMHDFCEAQMSIPYSSEARLRYLRKLPLPSLLKYSVPYSMRRSVTINFHALCKHSYFVIIVRHLWFV